MSPHHRPSRCDPKHQVEEGAPGLRGWQRQVDLARAIIASTARHTFSRWPTSSKSIHLVGLRGRE
eukprot:14157587-Alexandrium_andersonii.AAC.1